MPYMFFELYELNNQFNQALSCFPEDDINGNGIADAMENAISDWANGWDDLSGTSGMYDRDGDGDVDYTDASGIFSDMANNTSDPQLQDQYSDQSVNANIAGGIFDWIQGDDNVD
jgi:hypothetical protein